MKQYLLKKFLFVMIVGLSGCANLYHREQYNVSPEALPIQKKISLHHLHENKSSQNNSLKNITANDETPIQNLMA